MVFFCFNRKSKMLLSRSIVSCVLIFSGVSQATAWCDTLDFTGNFNGNIWQSVFPDFFTCSYKLDWSSRDSLRIVPALAIFPDCKGGGQTRVLQFPQGTLTIVNHSSLEHYCQLEHFSVDLNRDGFPKCYR